MPWVTPSLRDVRSLVRDNIRGALPGADANVPNSVLRVLSDAQGGLCHLTLQYIDWLSRQLLPDTAETEWLDRHGEIWLRNADGTKGRKEATFASGTVTVTGVAGTVVPVSTEMTWRSLASGVVSYVTTEEVILGDTPVPVHVDALTAGAVGNRLAGDELQIELGISGLDRSVTVVVADGGADTENDDDLRSRVLFRIQQPPMGGDADDYIAWALQVPGVTRAWSYPLEMGMGTVTVRFMMDDLRADNYGLPTASDVAAVRAHLDSERPVAVRDFFVEVPIPHLINYTINELSRDDAATRTAIEASLQAMFRQRAKPGQTIYKSWAIEAISSAIGEEHHDLSGDNVIMPSTGHMPILGGIIYA